MRVDGEDSHCFPRSPTWFLVCPRSVRVLRSTEYDGNRSFLAKLRERASARAKRGECRMALESWSGLRLGLMGLGYQRVLWLHIACRRHGLFRVGLPEELEFYLCPTCRQACSASILCEGFTKQPLPFPPERIHAQLTSWERRALLAEEKIAKPKRIADRHREKYEGVPEYQPACDSRPRANIVRSWAMPDR
jgi:hypothetical protein